MLESGEIYVESSHTNLIDIHGSRTNKVLGDVLVSSHSCRCFYRQLNSHPCQVTRNPCKVPTDVQRVCFNLRYFIFSVLITSKAQAVDRPELRGMTDVVIVSTKGHVVKGEHLGRHLLSMTGGGEYCYLRAGILSLM